MGNNTLASPVNGTCLLVEDEPIIAMGVADQLDEIGVKETHICSNAKSAIEYLRQNTPDFAFLDIELGGGTTSASIALRLRELDVPFAFLSGYGDTRNLGPQFRDAFCFVKPVKTMALRTHFNVPA